MLDSKALPKKSSMLGNCVGSPVESIPKLEVIKQGSLAEEIALINGEQKSVHVVVKNSPFEIELGFQHSTNPSSINLNQLNFDAKLIYDGDDEGKEVIYVKSKPLDFRRKVNEQGSKVTIDFRIKVLSSQHEDMLFRILIRTLDPVTGLVYHPSLLLFTQPIKVISKPEQLKKISKKRSFNELMAEKITMIESQQQTNQLIMEKLFHIVTNVSMSNSSMNQLSNNNPTDLRSLLSSISTSHNISYTSNINTNSLFENLYQNLSSNVSYQNQHIQSSNNNNPRFVLPRENLQEEFNQISSQNNFQYALHPKRLDVKNLHVHNNQQQVNKENISILHGPHHPVTLHEAQTTNYNIVNRNITGQRNVTTDAKLSFINYTFGANGRKTQTIPNNNTPENVNPPHNYGNNYQVDNALYSDIEYQNDSNIQNGFPEKRAFDAWNVLEKTFVNHPTTSLDSHPLPPRMIPKQPDHATHMPPANSNFNFILSDKTPKINNNNHNNHNSNHNQINNSFIHNNNTINNNFIIDDEGHYKSKDKKIREENSFERSFEKFLNVYNSLPQEEKPVKIRKIIRHASQKDTEKIIAFLNLFANQSIHQLIRCSSSQCGCQNCPYQKELERIDGFYRECLSNPSTNL